MINRTIFRAAPMDMGTKMALEGLSDGVVIGQYSYSANTATAATTATAAQITGGSDTTVLNMTGTLAAGAALTLPTAAQVIAAIPNAVIGQTYLLRVINGGAGAFAWTVTTAAGWTLTGTLTVAQNTQRDFLVTVTSGSTLTAQSMGTVAVTAV